MKANPKYLYPNPPYKIAPANASLTQYIESLETNKIVTYPPPVDTVKKRNCRQDLLHIQLNHAFIEKELETARQMQREKRILLDNQWKELENKELALREEFLKFTQFVRENVDKRERSLVTIREEKCKVCFHMDKIEDLRSNYAKLEIIKNDMEEHIRKYNIFQDYLTLFLKRYPAFKQLQTIVNRYYSLEETKKSIADNQQDILNLLETSKDHMVKLIESKFFIIMGLTNDIANLQTRFETAKSKALYSEVLLAETQNSAVKKITEIVEVKASIWLTYCQMAKNKRSSASSRLKKWDTEGQLTFIKRSMAELRQVNALVRKKLEEDKDVE